MKGRLIKEAEDTLRNLIELKKSQERKIQELSDLKCVNLNRGYKRNGKYYYSVRKRGNATTEYIGGESSEAVNRIKEYRYLKKSLYVIENDIQVISNLLRKYLEYDYDAINVMLPLTYRGARLKTATGISASKEAWIQEAERKKKISAGFMTDGLKVRTSDGRLVRSKSEAIIYNYLLSMDVTFAYERPMLIGSKMFYPDFTLLSEIDYKTEIIIEHQGMMNEISYRNHFNDKLLSYWRAGYIQGINVFFMFDSVEGGLDLNPIHNVIRNHIRPE